ncbi:hypothetical protein ABZW32_35205, partial [Streptomyces sp. NPDC004667]
MQQAGGLAAFGEEPGGRGRDGHSRRGGPSGRSRPSRPSRPSGRYHAWPPGVYPELLERAGFREVAQQHPTVEEAQ